MELTLEIPIPHLEYFLPLTDFPFGLAQLVLDDGYKGAQAYRALYEGCLLDNGLYELGEPLPLKDLVKAAEIVKPVAVIAPDWMGNMTKTLHVTEQLVKIKEKGNYPWSVGGVVQGRNIGERLSCYMALLSLGCEPVCFPFRTPRLTTIEVVHHIFGFRKDKWYHLLGLSDFRELKLKHEGRWSVDTSKPFKGLYFGEMTGIRGHGKLDVHKKLPFGSIAAALWNIAYLRKKIQEGKDDK